jgi:hypothetical protein
MQILIPSWGMRGCPPLPESLRVAWASELVPAWVALELGLKREATYSEVDVEAWAQCSHAELPESIKKFLINVVSMRRSSIGRLRVFVRPWPRSLDPTLLSWSNRTRNCLRTAALLSDVSRLSGLTFADLFSIQAMGAVSVLDFACVAEAAFTPNKQTTIGIADISGDVSSRLLEAIDAFWAHQISSQDPRFSDLLPPGNLTVFERLEQLTAEPEDPPLQEILLARALPALEERMSSISRLPLEAALTEFVEKASGKRGAHLQALLRRLGCDGEPAVTLEEAGSLLGITRERMRQIHKKFSERAPNHPIFMPRLDEAIKVIRESAPISVDRASELIRAKRISARPFHPKSLLAASEFCGRSQPFEIDNSAGFERVIVERRREFERAALSVAFRQAGASGATNIQEVSAELASRGQSEVSDEIVRRLLKDRRELEFLNEDWFWYKTEIPERNRLRNVTRKMLSVTSPIPIGEVREGVHRHYKIRGSRGLGSWPLVTPPRAVLKELYRLHPEFSIDSSGLVAPVEQLEYGSELNSTERVILEVLRSSPACLLDRSSLARRCAELGMNPNTFSQYLSSSPIIAHIGTDMWSLRGARVDPAAVEALREANASTPSEKRVIDHGWSGDGELWIAARLRELTSNFVLGVPSAIRRFVVGREFPAIDEHGLAAGTVRVNAEGTSYGYGRFLARRGADTDDILLISFRLAAGASTLRLIDDEELEAISPDV